MCNETLISDVKILVMREHDLFKEPVSSYSMEGGQPDVKTTKSGLCPGPVRQRVTCKIRQRFSYGVVEGCSAPDVWLGEQVPYIC